MEFLVSQFAFPETKTDQENARDTYVGIVPKFDSPFHLYINLKDLEESSYIKIIIFSLGAKKEILWGTFNTNTNKFDFRANCEYTLNQLRSFMQEWNSFGFESIANSVADRIHIAMNSFNPDSKILTEDEYKILKYFLAYIDNKITFEEFQKVGFLAPSVNIPKIINPPASAKKIVPVIPPPPVPKRPPEPKVPNLALYLTFNTQSQKPGQILRFASITVTLLFDTNGEYIPINDGFTNFQTGAMFHLIRRASNRLALDKTNPNMQGNKHQLV